MSMNIHFEATRLIQVVGSDLIETQTEYFSDVWQTPTETSYEILESDNDFKAYCDWVMSVSETVSKEVYAPGDLFCEGPVIGYNLVNRGEQHISLFEGWINDMQIRGFTINPVVM
jgi:hypothetical protein